MMLDTCALLWLATGDRRLSPAALRDINEAPVLCICAASGFEIALKAAKGKLKLSAPPRRWFEIAIDTHGLSVLAVDLETSILAAELPWIHDDPCDRLIIAAAKLNSMKVLTDDDRFEGYGVEVVRPR